jgi:hypothetical protein
LSLEPRVAAGVEYLLELTLDDDDGGIEILNEAPRLFEFALDPLGSTWRRRLPFGQGEASSFAVSLFGGGMSGLELGNAGSSRDKLAFDLLALGCGLLYRLPTLAGESLSVQRSPPSPCGLAFAEARSAFGGR